MLAILLLHACAKTHSSETLLSKPSSQTQLQQYTPKPKTTVKPNQKIIYHTVSKGETLASIAKRYGYTEAEIAASNGIYPPYTITPGQTLVIIRSPIILHGYNYDAIPVKIPPPPKAEQLND